MPTLGNPPRGGIVSLRNVLVLAAIVATVGAIVVLVRRRYEGGWDNDSNVRAKPL